MTPRSHKYYSNSYFAVEEMPCFTRYAGVGRCSSCGGHRRKMAYMSGADLSVLLRGLN